jgi:hypothetical protein
MSNATAAIIFVAASLVVIAAAVLIVRGYLRRRCPARSRSAERAAKGPAGGQADGAIPGPFHFRNLPAFSGLFRRVPSSVSALGDGMREALVSGSPVRGLSAGNKSPARSGAKAPEGNKQLYPLGMPLSIGCYGTSSSLAHAFHSSQHF